MSAYQEQAEDHVIPPPPSISSPSQPFPVCIQSYKLPFHLTCNLLEPLPNPYLLFVSLSSFFSCLFFFLSLLRLKLPPSTKTGGSRCRLMTSFFPQLLSLPVTQNPVRQIHYLIWHRARGSLAAPPPPPNLLKGASTHVRTHAHTRACAHVCQPNMSAHIRRLGGRRSLFTSSTPERRQSAFVVPMRDKTFFFLKVFNISKCTTMHRISKHSRRYDSNTASVLPSASHPAAAAAQLLARKRYVSFPT